MYIALGLIPRVEKKNELDECSPVSDFYTLLSR
jgi:hypothetical protein